MKQLFIILLLVNTLSVFAQTSSSAYLNFLIQQETIVGTELVLLTKKINSKDKIELTAQLQKLRSEADAAVDRVEEEVAYGKSKYLKQAAIDYLASFKHISKHELIDLVELFTKPNTESSDKGLVDDYFGRIFQHINKYEIVYKAAIEKYCKEHKIEMPEAYQKFYLNETK